MYCLPKAISFQFISLMFSFTIENLFILEIFKFCLSGSYQLARDHSRSLLFLTVVSVNLWSPESWGLLHLALHSSLFLYKIWLWVIPQVIPLSLSSLYHSSPHFKPFLLYLHVSSNYHYFTSFFPKPTHPCLTIFPNPSLHHLLHH